MSDTLWVLMDKVSSIQEEMGNVSRQKFKKGAKRNARDQKHCKKMKKVSDGFF